MGIYRRGIPGKFGDVDDADEALKMIQFAFDHGITHFDLANNYGTPFGSAEKNFGKIPQSVGRYVHCGSRP